MAELYQLRVVLCGVSPLVWRRLLIASETTSLNYTKSSELAFDWSAEHLHSFRIHGRDYGTSKSHFLAFTYTAENAFAMNTTSQQKHFPIRK